MTGRLAAALLLSALAVSTPAAAAIVTVDFAGSFVGAFGGGALVANGTPFSGSFSYDSDTVPTAPPTFDAIYALPGLADVTIGGVGYQGALTARVNNGNYEAVRFFIALPDSRNLGLVTVSLPPGSVTAFGLPADPAFFATTFQAGYTDTAFRGNYGPATLTASLTSSAVPEPAAWTLMILGFGAVGVTMRRRSHSWRARTA